MHRIVFIVVFLFSCNLFGQRFKVRHHLPNAIDNTAKAIFESSAGNYIGGGFVIDTINGTPINRIAIMGLNNLGQLQWTKKYGKASPEYLNNGFIARSFYKLNNNLYYAGCARDSNSKQIGVLIKFDLNGDTIWQKLYRDLDSLEDVIPQMLTASVDGGFLITGFFQNWSANGYNKVLVIKTNSNGNELWRKKVGKIPPDVADGKAVVQDTITKKIVIVGYQYIGGIKNYDNVLILDSLGNKLQQLSYVTGIANDLIQTRDKKFILAGYLITPINPNSDYSQAYAVKFDLNNPTIPIWTTIIGKEHYTSGFNCLRELNSGEVLVSEWIDTLYQSPMNTLVGFLKLDINGQVKWSRRYDYKINNISKSNSMGVRSLELTTDGGWVVAIENFNYPGTNPFFFVKYDSTGCDTTIAYCKYVSDVSITNVISKEENIEIYPNPVSDALNVNISNANLNEYKLRVVNVLGQEIEFASELVNGKEETGFRIQTNKLNKGIYFLEVYSDGKIVATEKIIKE